MYSLPQILTGVIALNPRQGMSLTNGAMERTCTTPVYDRILGDDGEEIVLNYLEDTNLSSRAYGRRRYVAIYVRVSTDRQADGFSVEDQAARAIRYCISNRLAFRVFADTGLSGSLPPDIPFLLERMAKKRAHRYHTIFTNIFLSEYVTRYTEAEKTALTRYRDERVELIRTGRSAAEADDDAEIKKGKIRTGLTCMLHAVPDIHQIVVTDLSRLARSAAITEEVVERILDAKISLVGLIEPINDIEGIGTKVLAWQAEQFLNSLTAASIRGTLALLESGRAPSLNNLPWWLERDRDGRAVPHRLRWEAGREIITRYLAGETPYQIWLWLRESNIPAPSKGTNPGRKGWQMTQITSYCLDARPATGVCEYYGLDWHVLPALTSEDEWWEIRQMRTEAAKPKRGRKETAARHLLAGVLKCTCGEPMYYHPMGKQANQYTCQALRSRVTGDDKRARHVTIMASLLEDWVNEVMISHPISLLQRYMGGEEYDPTSESIRSLSERLERVQEDRKQQERDARLEAVGVFSTAGLGEDNPAFEGLVINFVKAKVQEIKATERRIEIDLKGERQRQATLEMTADWAGLEQQASRWSSLSEREKNAILQALFVSFAWQRDEEARREWIVPTLRAAEPTALEPIKVLTGQGTKTIRRTLEPAAAWMQRAIGIEHNVPILAPKEFGDHADFAPASAMDFSPGDAPPRSYVFWHKPLK